VDARNSAPGLTAQWASPKHDNKRYSAKRYRLEISALSSSSGQRIARYAYSGLRNVIIREK